MTEQEQQTSGIKKFFRITPDDLRPFSDSRVTTAAVISFIPIMPLAPIGVHDFILKRHSQGALHLLIVVAAYGIALISNLFLQSPGNTYEYGAPVIFLENSLPTIGLLVSYAWSAVEGVQILLGKDKLEPNRSSLPSTKAEATTDVKSLPSTKAEATTDAKNKKERRAITLGVISIITALIPIALLAYWAFYSGGSDRNGLGAGWLVVAYYMTVGFPLATASVICGLVGLVTGAKNYRWVPMIGLLLKAATLLYLLSIWPTSG